MVKFKNDDVKKASLKLRKYVKEGNGMPKSITMKDVNGKSHKLSKKEYMGLFEQRNVYCLKHGRTPKTITLNTTANNPLVMDYQNNGHTCCPTSLSMCIGFLFSYHSESECAKALGTSNNGTSPSQLVNNCGKVNTVATPIKRNWSSVKKSLDKHRPVIAHIQTKPAKCLNYVGDYGHYIVIYGVYKKGLTKYYRVADPTKGIQTCKASVLDKATNGRDIKYYSIKPK